MTTTPVQCPKCRAWLLEGVFDSAGLVPCPACGTPVGVDVFPAFFRPAPIGAGGEAVVMDGESACFFHPQKKAVIPCEGCGRFLCALCDCELGGHHYCPTCLEAGAAKGKIKALSNSRTLYDGIALSLALLPMVTVYFTILGAPATLFVVFRYWNAPRSLVRPNRFRFVLAALFAVLQIGVWVVAIIMLTNRHG